MINQMSIILLKFRFKKDTKNQLIMSPVKETTDSQISKKI
jgi:hypothetical protein